MAINPNISLAVKGIELQDPLAQYGRVAAIQGAQQQNQLAQLQMQQAQREQESTNALNRAYAAAYNPQTGEIDVNKLRGSLSTGGFGSKLPAVEKGLLELQTARTAQQKGQADLLDSKLKQSRQFLETLDPSSPSAAEAYMQWHRANHADPVIGKALEARGITVDQSMQRIQQLMQTPGGLARLINESKLGTEEFMKQNKPTTQVIDQSGQRQVIQIPGLGGTPTTVSTYADVPLPAAVEQQKSRIAQAGRPVTTITNVAEKAEAGEFGKLIVQQYDAISKQASVAARTLPSIEANLATLNKGLDTGFGTDAKAAGARVLGALGVKDAEKFATDTQTFQSNAISAVLQKQLEQKGPQTESDARRIEQIGAELAKTKDANRFILDLAKEQLRRDIEQRNFYTEWKKGPGKGSFNGAEDAWFAGEGGKSLFARPALKKYAVGAPSAASQIPGNAPVPARAAPAPAVAPNIDALLNKYK
jgi:hypothetical protein